MSRSRFFEGLIIGSIIGAISTLLLSNIDCEDACLTTTDEKADAEKKVKSEGKKENTEKMVSKTLDAIEQGFEKISSMIDEKGKGKA